MLHGRCTSWWSMGVTMCSESYRSAKKSLKSNPDVKAPKMVAKARLATATSEKHTGSPQAEPSDH